MRPYPPLVYGGGLLLALLGHLIHPLSLPGAWYVRALGALPLVATVVLAWRAEREFRIAQTPLMPFQDAAALVTTGPFRFSRNPIYLGFTLGICGIALLTASWWPLITLVPALAVMTTVIRGEETRLQRLFGQEYERYRQRVRRWL